MIDRGDVWWADLGQPRGSAPALRRPVLVVSDNAFNASRLATVIVVALTTNARLAALHGNVAVAAELSSLPADSVVNVTALITVDRTALEERVGAVPRWLVEQVDDGLRRVLSL